MALEIRVLRAGDEHVLDNVAEGVFDGPIDAALRSEFLRDPRHHLCLGIQDGIVVGFASAVHYVHPDKPPQLWINEVGVSASHQGRGHRESSFVRSAIGWARNRLHRSVGVDGRRECRG